MHIQNLVVTLATFTQFSKFMFRDLGRNLKSTGWHYKHDQGVELEHTCIATKNKSNQLSEWD